MAILSLPCQHASLQVKHRRESKSAQQGSRSGASDSSAAHANDWMSLVSFELMNSLHFDKKEEGEGRVRNILIGQREL